MKKLALVLCTVMAICCAGSAFAATSDGNVTNSRNSKTVLQTENTETTKAAMPCFRAGDTLNFKVNGLSGNQLTIISYKVDKDIANETVQYIDQRTISNSEDTIKYVIRNIEQGIYKVSVKSGSDDVYSLYYKVGTPTVETVKKDNMNYFIKQNNSDGTYSIGFVGRADMGSKDVSFADAGVKSFGFSITAANTTKVFDLTEDQMKQIDEDVNAKILKDSNEVGGAYSVYFVQTLYGVPENVVTDGISGTATMTDTTTSGNNTAE